MPAYKLNGKPLIYFAGYAKHIGLLRDAVSHAAFAEELSHYKQGKGSVRVPTQPGDALGSDRAHRRLQGRRVVRAITTKDWPRPPSARTTRLLEAEKLRRRVCTAHEQVEQRAEADADAEGGRVTTHHPRILFWWASHAAQVMNAFAVNPASARIAAAGRLPAACSRTSSNCPAKAVVLKNFLNMAVGTKSRRRSSPGVRRRLRAWELIVCVMPDDTNRNPSQRVGSTRASGRVATVGRGLPHLHRTPTRRQLRRSSCGRAAAKASASTPSSAPTTTSRWAASRACPGRPTRG